MESAGSCCSTLIPSRYQPRSGAKPYVYGDTEIEALLKAALALFPANGLRRWTYHYLFGLIAVTGIRLSEAIGLERADVDLEKGVLTVRESKFGKSRLVPLHPTTRSAHAERRDAHLGSRCGAHFFVAERGGRLLRQYVHRVFWRLSREIGLRRPGDHSGPRVHDFRHRFAICTSGPAARRVRFLHGEAPPGHSRLNVRSLWISTFA